MATTELQTRLVETFHRWLQESNHHRWSPHHPLRRIALEAFQKMGFPTSRHEDWKYTSLAPVLRPAYRIEPPSPAETSSLLSQLPALESLPGPHIWMLTGIPVVASLPPYVRLDSLLYSDGEVPPWLGEILRPDAETFIALNTAFAPDVATLSLAGQAKEILHIAVVTSAVEEPQLSQPRLCLTLEPEARGRVLLSFHTLGSYPSLTNFVAEVRLAPNSDLELILWQTEPSESFLITTVGAELDRSARLTVWTLALGGALIRNNLYIRLAAPGAETQLFGATMVSGQQIVDHRTQVEHQAEQCLSNQLYKSIADAQATVTFTGRIYVHPRAQKTNAYQSHRAVLLSEKATVNARPQLEIYADDVRCTHGATVGSLDEDALFYMRSRGIPLDYARALLLHAFLSEPLKSLSDAALWEYADILIAERTHLQAAKP